DFILIIIALDISLLGKEQSRPDDTGKDDEDAEDFDAYSNQMDQIAYAWFEGIFYPGALLPCASEPNDPTPPRDLMPLPPNSLVSVALRAQWGSTTQVTLWDTQTTDRGVLCLARLAQLSRMMTRSSSSFCFASKSIVRSRNGNESCTKRPVHYFDHRAAG